MQHLKQSTASQAVVIGPFIDATDGVTAMTALTISNTDIRLSKNGANIVGKNSGGGTHDELGYYTITLDATDTNTVGRLQVLVHESGALPVYHEYEVLEEAIYDALYAASATGLLPANVTQFGGNAGTFASGRPEVNTSHIAGAAVSTSAAQIGVNVVNAGGTAWATVLTNLVTSIWGATTRVLTAGTNIALAKGTGVTGFNDLSASQVNAEVDTALADYDGPTNAEMIARTLANTVYANTTHITNLTNNVTAVSGNVISYGTTTGTIFTIVTDAKAEQANTTHVTNLHNNLASISANVIGYGTTTGLIWTLATNTEAMVTDLYTTIEEGGTEGVYVFTEEALAQAPVGSGGASASDIWTYGDRTLTANVTIDGLDEETINAIAYPILVDLANTHAVVAGIAADYANTTNIQEVLDAINDVLDQGLVIIMGDVGGTGNDPSTVHLDLDNDFGHMELTDLLIDIQDATDGQHHTRWIERYIGDTSLAWLSNPLPFTPDNTDSYRIFAIRRDVVPALAVAVATGGSSSGDGVVTVANTGIWAAGSSNGLIGARLEITDISSATRNKVIATVRSSSESGGTVTLNLSTLPPFSPTTGDIVRLLPDSGRVDLRTINGSTATTTSAQLGVNVIQAGSIPWANVTANLVGLTANTVLLSNLATYSANTGSVAEAISTSANLGSSPISANVVSWRGVQPGNLDSNGFVPSNLTAVNGNTGRADELSNWLDNDEMALILARLIALPLTTAAVVSDDGNSSDVFVTNLSQTTDDHWAKTFCLITSGDLIGQVRPVLGYNGTTKALTVSPFTDEPDAGTTFAIINR